MHAANDPVVIVGARRTPVGAFQGQFAGVTAPRLGSVAIAAAVEQAGVRGEDIDEAIFGCCLMGGLKQAPARQAVLGAGLPPSIPCVTITKMCGSAMKSTMIVHDEILAGTVTIGIAGGMESMTNAPFIMPTGRSGHRLGHVQIYDHMLYDGLEDAYEGKLMGVYAELCAETHGFTRDAQDAFAAESVRRAQRAVLEGDFRDEIAPVTVADHKRGEVLVRDDETPGRCNIAKITGLKPAFKEGGTVTAANSSSISDGAAALILMRESESLKRGIMPLARIHGHATQAQESRWFATAPVGAIRKLLEKVKWTVDDVDLYEINEAFAVVTMFAMRELDITSDKVNVNGGACAMGHPIGATGARIIVTLLHALQKHGLKRGIAGLCIGGGEATALAIEMF
jgi:acetyl-CoA C-acetyltransferase